jgi:nitroimidazol reductase NimA-like FMN-containing flavoprotein (pyridoxamine 5'-phosphate oxidase superfamily)
MGTGWGTNDPRIDAAGGGAWVMSENAEGGSTMAESRELDWVDCERLLRAGMVGRVAVSTPNGPHIIPINYSVVDDAIVFRTSPYSLLGTYGRNAQLAFEVDHFDYPGHRGWSVVARGRGDTITNPQEIRHVTDQWPPRPWADGNRSLFFRLPWTDLSGRRLGGGWTQDNESPVRRTLSAL